MEKKGKEQTTVRLPVELKKAIEKEADKYSVSLNEMINRLLYEGLRVIHQKEWGFRHVPFHNRRQFHAV